MAPAEPGMSHRLGVRGVGSSICRALLLAGATCRAVFVGQVSWSARSSHPLWLWLAPTHVCLV